MKILVTGASGFIGSAVASHLTSLGHEVIQWVGPGKTAADIGVFSVDVAVESTFPDESVVRSLDAVVHCAGIAHRFGRITKEAFDRVNVLGVENTARFAVRCGASRFILLSSVLVYGQPGNADPITEDREPAPSDDYGRSKLAGEKAAIVICGEAGIALTILRPAPVIGEGGRGNVSRLIKAIERGRFIWIGNGGNLRSFVYVGDVARAVASALSSDEQVAVYNLTGGTIRVRSLVEIVSDRVGREAGKFAVPTWAAKSLYHASLVASFIPIIKRSRRTLGTWLADAVYSGEAIKQSCGFVAKTGIKEAIGREVDHHLREE